MNFAKKIEKLVRRANKLAAKGVAANRMTLTNVRDQLDRALYNAKNDHKNDSALIKAIIEIDTVMRAQLGKVFNA